MKNTRFLLLFLLCAWFSGCGRAVPAPLPEDTPEPAAVLEGREYGSKTRLISLEGSGVSEKELREVLPLLPGLERLEYPACPFSTETQLALHETFPDVDFIWPVCWADRTVSADSETLELPESTVSWEELKNLLPLFPRLREADLGGRKLTAEELASLWELCPDVDFRCGVELFFRTFDSFAEEIDLSGIPMEDTEEVEAALELFPRLRKVVMCECGLTNETMDALNRKYEDIRFVWLVNVFGCALRTDATGFIQYNLPPCYLEGGRASNLHYCTDLIALDLGHTGLTDEEMDFLPSMPHLQYLILADCHITDISDVALLQELTYFEVFESPVRDFSPLLSCPLLTDLNVSYNACFNEESVEVLRQMTQLERLWMYGTKLSGDELRVLTEALPDCIIQTGPAQSSTGGGWRDHDHYRAMRDALHSRYMW